MWNRKKIIIRILSVLLCAGIAAGISLRAATKRNISVYSIDQPMVYEVASNRHTRYAPPREVTVRMTTDGFEKKMDNGTISLWYSPENDSIKVVDHRSGYVWGCVEDIENSGLNKTWRSRANSLCYISYFDKDNTEQRIGISENAFSLQYQWGTEEAVCNVSAKKLGLFFSFKISLLNNALRFSLEDNSIKETGKNRLATVSFVNFFGAVYEDQISGYLLIPDGSGALIRFSKAQNYSSGYYKKVFGSDLSIDADTTLNNLNGNRTDDYATEEATVSVPIWGMVHGENQNAFYASIDNGEEYATLSAVPAGAEILSVKFTRCYASFTYRSIYDKRVSVSKTIKAVAEEKNRVNPVVTYTFLTGKDANYSGISSDYRNRLIKDGILSETPKNHTATPLLLNICASDVQKGFIFNKLSLLTSAKQTEQILNSLEKSGISSPSVLLSGWVKGGLNGSKYGALNFEKKVADKLQIESLRNRVIKNGGTFTLYINTMTANEDQISRNREAALNASSDILKTTVPNPSLMYPVTYYLRVSKILNLLETAPNKLPDFDFLYGELAKTCYSDYTVGQEISRDTVIKKICEQLSAGKKKLMFDGANSYVLPYADSIIEMPVASSQYLYETDSVPFMQMLLRGSIDCYAPYANQGLYSKAGILKMIEYGIYPSFMIMAADNFDLYNTPLENYFSLNYENWKPRIVSVYSDVSRALNKVDGQYMISHTAIADGVYKSVYSKGTEIYVNYETEAYVADNISVPAGGYLVKEG